MLHPMCVFKKEITLEYKIGELIECRHKDTKKVFKGTVWQAEVGCDEGEPAPYYAQYRLICPEKLGESYVCACCYHIEKLGE